MRVKAAIDSTLYWRNLTFGIEDGLVSTVGLLSGIAAANVPKSTIILTGIVLILVEAFSMGIGSFLTEHSVEEMKKHHEVPTGQAITGGIIMLFSYFFAGFIPLFPYWVFAQPQALPVSIIASLFTLVILASISANKFKVNIIKHTIEITILGSIAIGVGVASAQILKGLI